MGYSRSQLGLRVKIVDDSANRANRMDVKTGSAADSESSEIRFDIGGTYVVTKEVMITARENAMWFRLVSEDGTLNDQFYVPKNSTIAIDFAARGFTVQNYTAGETAEYHVIAEVVER